jgi:hypothetical protein
MKTEGGNMAKGKKERKKKRRKKAENKEKKGWFKWLCSPSLGF